MSGSERLSSLSGSKRAASPTNATAETAAQRMRLSEAAAANPPAAVRSPPSAAQRCADDTLALVFGLIKFEELVSAARTCKAWLAASAKGQPRGLTQRFARDERLSDFCTSSSPLKKHVSRVYCTSAVQLGLEQLAQLGRLPLLTSMDVQLNAADVTRLMDEQGGEALAALKAAFPAKLQELALSMSTAQSLAAHQLLLDALPAMKELQNLTLIPHINVVADQSAALSLEPLLQLPHLTHLRWRVANPTVQELSTIKQIATLQSLECGYGWTAAQLSVLCRPPHRLQQLQEINLWETDADEAVLTEVACLPALTSLELAAPTAGAYAFVPRFTRLRRLWVSLEDDHDALDQQADHDALLASAVSACPGLTDLTLVLWECSEQFGSQLMLAVPRLCKLRFDRCSLPSLRFLRHAPNLTDLAFDDCAAVRLGHVFGIGSFVPQLGCLSLVWCAGLQLDETEVQMLSPPDAIGLPHLREFHYLPLRREESDSGGEDVDAPGAANPD